MFFNVEINEKYINLLIENCVIRNIIKLCYKVEIINMRKCLECVFFFIIILLIIFYFILLLYWRFIWDRIAFV